VALPFSPHLLEGLTLALGHLEAVHRDKHRASSVHASFDLSVTIQVEGRILDHASSNPAPSVAARRGIVAPWLRRVPSAWTSTARWPTWQPATSPSTCARPRSTASRSR